MSIVARCPAPDKFAHTYAGLTIWLVSAVVLGKPLSSVWPLATVVAAELGNEIMDRFAHGSWMWHDTLTDMAATWFWPMVLSLAFKVRPLLTAANRRIGSRH